MVVGFASIVITATTISLIFTILFQIRRHRDNVLYQRERKEREKEKEREQAKSAYHSFLCNVETGNPLPQEIKKDMALYMNKSLYEDMFTDAFAHSLDRMAQAQIDKATATPKEYNHANLSKGDFVHSASKSITFNGTSGTSVTMSDYALPTISFKGGPTEAVVNPARGDISYDIDGQRMMMYDGNGWVELSAEPVRKKEKRPTNCPNCGAPVRGSACEYCGTTF